MNFLLVFVSAKRNNILKQRRITQVRTKHWKLSWENCLWKQWTESYLYSMSASIGVDSFGNKFVLTFCRKLPPHPFPWSAETKRNKKKVYFHRIKWHNKSSHLVFPCWQWQPCCCRQSTATTMTVNKLISSTWLSVRRVSCICHHVSLCHICFACLMMMTRRQGKKL